MNFLNLTQQRQSVRAYTSQPVAQEQVDYILQAASLAPSACNAQPWKLIVVDDLEKRFAVADATANKALGMNHFTKQAPLLLVLVEERVNLTSKIGSWVKKKNYQELDLGIFAAHITLAAADRGLGTCIIGWFDEIKIQKILNIPKNKHVVLVITLGYSDQPLREKKRKALNQIISYDNY